MAPVEPQSRETLRRLLRDGAFFTRHEGEPLRDRTGTVVPWLYHGSEVFLSAEGLALAGSVLSARLLAFGGCQLATYGTSAIPLLAACLAHGRHPSGIVIRKERESHGVARVLEGPVVPGLPVVVVDDSLSSGESLRAAFRALESAGLRVLGAVCLVEFSGYGAREWLVARGYRIDTVYDVWTELDRSGVISAPDPVHAASWSARSVPDGLTPAAAAREVAVELLSSGRLLRPPRAFDGPHDAVGGTFVSIRRRHDDVRLARSGFRRADGDADPRTDVVLATERAVAAAGLRSAADLRAVKLAVSFVSAPRPVGADQIEPARRALGVRGLGPLARTGLALPNAPHYEDEIQQLRYARTVGGSFWDREPTELVAHEVERSIEPGETWPGYGAPAPEPDWTRSSTFATAIETVLLDAVRSLAGARPGTTPLCPAPLEPVSLVAVSLYSNGLVGCGTSTAGDLTTAVREAAGRAWSDGRYRPDDEARPDPDTLTAVVSLLVRPRLLGTVPVARLPLFYRLGRDSLEAQNPDGRGIVLAHFAVQQNLSEETYQEQVLRKAGLSGAAGVTWTAYETVGWVVSSEHESRLELGYPDRRGQGPARPDAATEALGLARATAGFILRQRLEDGLPAYSWSPWAGRGGAAGTATRVLIAGTALAEAAPLLGAEVGTAAEDIADAFVEHGGLGAPRPGLTWDVAAQAQLVQLLIALEPRPDRVALVARLAGRLRALVHPDGAVHAGAVRVEADLDLLSGSVLLALAQADTWLGDALAGIDVAAVLRFARRRFRLSHPWGMVWWHSQAWAALARRGHEGADDLVLEIVDWAVGRQNRESGAFLIDDLEPRRLSFLSGCVLEGVAAGWCVARDRGDQDRTERYGRSWQDGIRFLDRLTVGPDDLFFSPDPAGGVGGVRATLPSSELRIDVAGHALRALAGGLRVLDVPLLDQHDDQHGDQPGVRHDVVTAVVRT